MCFGFFSTVPGLVSSARNTTMAGSFSPLSVSRTEMNIFEINEKLCCQLEASLKQFQDLKKKFLVSEAIAYTLGQPAVEIQLVL
jgi:hypothetical protein